MPHSHVDEVSMWWDHHAEQDLSHIQAAVCQLERLGNGLGNVEVSAVMNPEYWRARIREVMARPDVPPRIVQKGLALLARLDRLPGAPRTEGRNER
jgi:hypothetical protein